MHARVQDLSGGDSSWQTPIQLWQCNALVNQAWVWEDYQIKLAGANYPGKCIVSAPTVKSLDAPPRLPFSCPLGDACSGFTRRRRQERQLSLVVGGAWLCFWPATCACRENLPPSAGCPPVGDAPREEMRHSLHQNAASHPTLCTAACHSLHRMPLSVDRVPLASPHAALLTGGACERRSAMAATASGGRSTAHRSNSRRTPCSASICRAGM